LFDWLSDRFWQPRSGEMFIAAMIDHQSAPGERNISVAHKWA
jgi:hypothetical protein